MLSAYRSFQLLQNTSSIDSIFLSYFDLRDFRFSDAYHSSFGRLFNFEIFNFAPVSTLLFVRNYSVPHHGRASTMVATILWHHDTHCRLWTSHQRSASSPPTPLSPTSSTSRKHPCRSTHSLSSTTRNVSTRTLAPTRSISPHPTPPQLGVVPPNIPNLPDTWTPSDTHLDTNTVHGHTLFRTIQPTQWSRKYNLAGQQVLDIFPWQLSRFGLQDHSLRILSQGRYTGIVTTRSIAEAVFTSQLLPEMRAHNLDIDNIAEYLHQQADQSIPNKTTEAKQFMQPLISRIIDFLRGLTPPAGEGTALRKLQLQTDRLQQQESELQRARDKLKNHGIALTPTKPGPHPAPSSATHPPHLPLTAPSAITTNTSLNPTTQTLHDNSPANYAAAGIQKWLKTLPPATQTQVNNIQQILRDERITKEQLQEAATRYGIPLARVLKLPPRSLQQLVAAGSALAA